MKQNSGGRGGSGEGQLKIRDGEGKLCKAPLNVRAANCRRALYHPELLIIQYNW